MAPGQSVDRRRLSLAGWPPRASIDRGRDLPLAAQPGPRRSIGRGADSVHLHHGLPSTTVDEPTPDRHGQQFAARIDPRADKDLFFAFLYNALCMPVAAGVLYPFFGLLLNPIIAGAAMSLSSVSVISNALRLRNVTL
ncbi:MAG: hypothetical protein HY815_32445 [Candidatus Riflebacteria bacterium]|nr:hypothetical protein [Candidatus Riflebacteria bacterium]